jgi:hypothetical protein
VGMTVTVIDWLYLSGGSLSADESSPPARWTEWVPLVFAPWPSREFFLIFCSRLRFWTLGIGAMAASQSIGPSSISLDRRYVIG